MKRIILILMLLCPLCLDAQIVGGNKGGAVSGSAALLTDTTYASTNQDNSWHLYSSSDTKVCQSWQSTGGELREIDWYLSKWGTPTGNVTATVYAHTGTFGTSSVPTGSALATSATFNIATLTTSYAITTLSFSGANRIQLTKETYYVTCCEYSGGDSSNYLRLGDDESSPSAPGNSSDYISSYSAESGDDNIFAVRVWR